MSRQPGSKRLLPRGPFGGTPPGRLCRSATDGMKRTPGLRSNQGTRVARPWNFSIVVPRPIPAPQNPVLLRERWVSADQRSCPCHRAQTRVAIGGGAAFVHFGTSAGDSILLIILQTSFKNIDWLLTPPYHPPTFAHARVNPGLQDRPTRWSWPPRPSTESPPNDRPRRSHERRGRPARSDP